MWCGLSRMLGSVADRNANTIRVLERRVDISVSGLWTGRPLGLHSLFYNRTQYQKSYWPKTNKNSPPFRMSFLQDRF